MTHLILIFGATVLTLVAPRGLEAQRRVGEGDDTTYTRAAWMNLGFATDGGGEYIGVGGSFSSLVGSRHQLTGRFNYLQEFQLCIFGPCTTRPEERFELGALYGRGEQVGIIFASSSVGLALFGGRRTVDEPGAARLDQFTTVGVPIEVQLGHAQQ